MKNPSSSSWVAYTDGASRGNPGLAGCGAYLCSPEGQEYREFRFLDQVTNNQAEYEGLLLALTKLTELQADCIMLRADSELMIKQLKGEYRVKNANMVPLFRKAQVLLKNFSSVQFEHVPRAQNKIADGLANQAIDEHLLLADS
ncbi:MAG: ribonuclease H [uncultured bacterium]|nr:MAG: ribonuclease H [uncultured bacterium]